jgi:hypothetical protein
VSDTSNEQRARYLALDDERALSAQEVRCGQHRGRRRSWRTRNLGREFPKLIGHYPICDRSPSMAQGNTKGLQAKPASSKARHAAKAASAPKKGRRHEPPKKPALIKEAHMRKVSYHPFVRRPLHTPSHISGTQSQGHQVHRTANGICGVCWQADDHEKYRP